MSKALKNKVKLNDIVGVGYEVQQRIRGEGQVELLDALATAAPGWIAWGVLTVI